MWTIKVITIWYMVHIFSDIDECSMDSHTCDLYATCMNTMGSYECMCNMGYEGDGFICSGRILRQVVVNYVQSNIHSSKTLFAWWNKRITDCHTCMWRYDYVYEYFLAAMSECVIRYGVWRWRVCAYLICNSEY